jgi:hypothetical protein
LQLAHAKDMQNCQELSMILIGSFLGHMSLEHKPWHFCMHVYSTLQRAPLSNRYGSGTGTCALFTCLSIFINRYLHSSGNLKLSDFWIKPSPP